MQARDHDKCAAEDWIARMEKNLSENLSWTYGTNHLPVFSFPEHRRSFARARRIGADATLRACKRIVARNGEPLYVWRNRQALRSQQ